MINRIKILCLVLAVVLFGIACGNRKEENQKQYEVYYLDKNENHIVSLPYETETPKAEKEFLIKELLIQLSQQTEKINYKPVLVDFTVKNCILQESQVTLNLSKEYEMMDFTKEVLFVTGLRFKAEVYFTRYSLTRSRSVFPLTQTTIFA